MEPKLRERRIEVARDQGRRRLRRVLLVGLVVGVVALGVAATRSPLLDVDQIDVSGAGTTGADRVRDAAGIAVGDPMVSVDVGAAADAVEELPWVASASVTRSWPGTVAIAVTERVPVALVGDGKRAMAVDDRGRVLAPASDSGPDAEDRLPTVAGSAPAVGDSVGEAQRRAVAVVAELPPELAAEVAAASADDAGVTLVLRDDIEVRWGDAAQATAKIEALGVLLEQADRATIATIDLTVPRAATLTRKNGPK